MFSQLSYRSYSSDADFFSLWFDKIGSFDYDDMKLDNELKQEEGDREKLLNTIATGDDNAKYTDVDEDINKLAWMTIDCIGMQTDRSALISTEYYWTLGNASSICDISLKSDIGKHTPSTKINNVLNPPQKEEKKNDDYISHPCVVDNDESVNVSNENELESEASNESEASVNSNNSMKNNDKIPDFVEYLERYYDCVKSANTKIENNENNKNNSKNKNNNNNSNSYFGNGFINSKKYTRCIVDAVKCRVGIKNLESFLKIDLSDGIYNFKLTISNLIALLLEISDPNIHQQIISSAIGQKTPIAILYPMCKISHLRHTSYAPSTESNNNRDNSNVVSNVSHSTNSNNNKIIQTDWYLRDILQLASKSKLTEDISSQIKTNRNRPLVMFVGSDMVNGKSYMLSEMYPNQHFNTFCKQRNDNQITPLHKNSVDLIFSNDTNYHILDVHGSINDPLFEYCSRLGKNENKRGINRMDALAMVASLCDFNSKMAEIVRKMSRCTCAPDILQLFINFCLFEQCIDSFDGNINSNNNRKNTRHHDWLLYEYLYILDCIRNDANYNINSIGSYDLVANCHAMLSLYKICLKKHYLTTKQKVSGEYDKNSKYLNKLEQAMITFLEFSFCRGCTIEFSDGKYTTIADSMGDNFAEKVFASRTNDSNNNYNDNNDNNNSKLITIGIAGTQSIGKSTMLRS